ncbi:MAG: hypothetical protein K6T63_13095 [Alicyclobacillus herbarius]|uniref:hypothetical protein n=1 Tax=Alicyclobacillus TaxID=29330 RepID=UPI00082BA612|nr:MULTISPECIES: hypothetical protein [Alicyclobacillus]MCL6633553.1 hypothetical protein [Alicyclobacillus herbarius]
MVQAMKGFFNRQVFRWVVCEGRLPASLEDMTGKAWIFVAVIAAVLLVFGPEAISLVKGAVGSSLNTVSQNFSFPTN